MAGSGLERPASRNAPTCGGHETLPLTHDAQMSETGQDGAGSHELRRKQHGGQIHRPPTFRPRRDLQRLQLFDPSDLHPLPR